MTPVYVWRCKTRHPERFKQLCRVVEKKSFVLVVVEFSDGERIECKRRDIITAATSRSFLNNPELEAVR